MVLDRSQYPPAPVLFLLGLFDNCCNLFGTFFWNWREWMPFVDANGDGWLASKFRMETRISDILPRPLFFRDFLKNKGEQTVTASSLYEYAFETSSTSLSVLTTPTALAVVAVLVIVLRRIKGLLLPYFSQVGRKAARSTHGDQWELIPSNQVRIEKFGEYVFRLVFHSTISLLGVWYSRTQPWWQPGQTNVLYDGFPFQPIDPGMTWYYLVQCAYNVDAMISLMKISFSLSLQNPFASDTEPAVAENNFNGNGNARQTQNEKGSTKENQRDAAPIKFLGLEIRSPIKLTWKPTVRGDFQEMFIHHAVTNALVFGSSHFRLTRIGSMVFLVHDISDIPIDVSKLANFLKYKKTTAACFVIMVIVWCITRLYVLPFVIYRSILLESEQLLNTGVVPAEHYLAYYAFFLVLVGLLILLHFAWFLMFLKMGFLLVTKGETHDLSEHKQGEEQHQKVKKQQ